MASDPYKYFRVEARELLEALGQGVLELEKAGGPEVVRRLLRLAHTLKGAARVVRQPAIADRAHAIEGALGQAGEPPLPRERVSELLRLLDDIAAGVAALDLVGERESPGGAAAEPAFDTIRVEIAEMDALLEGVAETAVQLAELRREVAGIERIQALAGTLVDRIGARPSEASGASRADSLERARPLGEELLDALAHLRRRLAVGVEREERELLQVGDAAARLRLLPASAVFASLERAARDAALSLHKSVDFEASGGESRVDGSVLAAVRDALLHVVRNAVAHGIETEGERVSAGKPPRGRVELRVERRGHRLAFLCRDDGRGVDLEAVRGAAVRQGLLSSGEAERLGGDEVARLVLRGGLTTKATATHESGRGIGLDVVRETAARLKGEVVLRTEAGRGTTVELCVPVSLSSLPALLVGAAGIVAAVPLDAVRLCLRVDEAEVARSAGGASVVHAGQAIPLLPLAAALRGPVSAGRPRHAGPAVVVESAGERAGLGVDEILGTANVVVRSLPARMAADPLVAGASLDADGHPRLVLDAAGVVAAARAGRVPGPPAPAAAPPAPVLVIDDSLTTRMLEQSVLESAGYEVDLAVSGEEGLARARGRRYGLFLVDIEMPGMDGFEFLARARSDPLLRDVPAILVTSRSSAEDRRRGEQAGARAFIVKSEFEQASLLRSIRELVG